MSISHYFERVMYVYTHITRGVIVMPNMTLSIPDELHSFIKKHNGINWSEIARRAMSTQAKKIRIMNRIVEKSELTEEDELDHKIKAGLLKRFKE